MLKYSDVVQYLKQKGLKNKYIAEMTGLSCSYIRQYYGNDDCNHTKKKPNAREIKIASILITKRNKSFIDVVEIFSDKYDINVFYESLADEIKKQSLNIVDSFFEDASKLLKLGLSLRQVCKLFEVANDGFTPDHSSLRKHLIKKGIYTKVVNLTTQDKKLTLRDRKKILFFIRKNNLKLRIEDFMLLYSKFSDVHVKTLFELLENSENYEVKKCICCGKEYLFKDKKFRLCPQCRNKASYESHYGSLSI
ncbi:hypothetical protein FHQ18_09260 [Deferribacter autotrophicus]|uniref:Uncharacterized protein n=1 Tax=Deferribacter autotrophicus TaxID=500465 RepID=A0A5A8F237_9BACT|nr:hypothetical protein [Deferribacter autotrophicus]KAA0257520.1 hypothetical protein FHQ18_09260 [Deferribacter autotrophicus]